MSGDINRLDDGGCWLTMKHGSLKIEKDEIRRIIVYSRRDRVSERFSSSFRNTPSHPQPARAPTTPYDGIIHQEARKNNLDPALVKAVIKAESNFNPNDTSRKGACGLMQLMPGTADRLGVKSIYSPEENIRGGARFLRDMMAEFNGDREKALAAYNAGPGAVKKYRQVPPFRETRAYIDNVNRYYRRYRGDGGMCSYVDDAGCLNIYNVR
jgi:soluble lytic murein transglycosylase-like protein